MLRKIFLLLFFISISTISAQTKYFIYFKDKGISPEQSLNKSSEEYLQALNSLSEKSISRRIKNMGEDNFITFEDLPIRSEYLSAIEGLDIKIENKLNWFNAVSAHLNDDQYSKLSKLDFVDKVEPVKILIYSIPEYEQAKFMKGAIQSINNLNYGPSFAQLQLSQIPIVHSKGITGEGVLIGFLDTGFDWKNHESLQNANVVAEYDFVFKDSSTANDSNDVTGQHGHGTLVLSIAGGFKDSSLIGSAFGSDFILAKTEDIRSETHVEEDNYAAALEWMESYGVDITSSSLGYSIFDQDTYSYEYNDMDGKTTIVTRAAEFSFRRGVITITSAGNEGNTPWFYITAPADGINTLGIGAVDNNNNVAGFSSHGPSSDGRIKPDVVTQGVGVYGANAGNFSGYSFASGTSVAAPIASGIAALLLSAHPHLKNTQVRNIFFESADNNTSPDFERGYGLISAKNAIEFPNLEEMGLSFILHKTFLEPDAIKPETVTIHFSSDGENYEEVGMSFDGEFDYTYQLPIFFNGDLIDFYFTYLDSSNNNYRTPANDNYKFFYGQLNISLNLDLQRIFTDYIISDPYPNPFSPQLHNFTTIEIKSIGNEKLIITIIDALGQQVKNYSETTFPGTNKIIWQGISKKGIPVSSGAYFFLIDLEGKQYSRKVILLR